MKIILLSILITASIAVKAQTQLSPLNKGVIEYVTSVIGKKVDRGECWDLANEALTKVGAKWDGDYKYGKLVDPARDSIFPGDLIQFSGVVLKYKVGSKEYKEQMQHHTAIVYEVIAPGVFKLAHQNTGFSRKKVGLSDLRLEDVSRGKMKFYRPVQ